MYCDIFGVDNFYLYGKNILWWFCYLFIWSYINQFDKASLLMSRQLTRSLAVFFQLWFSILLHLIKPPPSLRSMPSYANRIWREHRICRFSCPEYFCDMHCPAHHSGIGHFLAVEPSELMFHLPLPHTVKYRPKILSFEYSNPWIFLVMTTFRNIWFYSRI